MSTLADFTNRLLGGTPSVSVEPRKSIVPIPILKFFNRGQEVMDSLKVKIADEQQNLAALESQRRVVALDVDLGEVGADKLAAVNKKIAAQRQKIEDLTAARDEAAARLAAEQAAKAAEAEAIKRQDVIRLLESVRKRTEYLDTTMPSVAAETARLKHDIDALKSLGVDVGLQNIHGRIPQALGFYSNGFLGKSFPPGWLDANAKLSPRVPTDEQVLAARSRQAKNTH